MQNLSVALTFARYGVRIFPCREMDSARGKCKSPYIEGGWHNASADESTIYAWWKEWRNAAVGLPCRLNGIIALDADRHGEEDGVAVLKQLFQRHNFDTSFVPCVLTPRNGLHVLFRRPSQLTDTKALIAPAIDIRDNAYIVAAGSAMADGQNYTLCCGSLQQLARAIGEDLLLECPGWLVAMSAKPKAPQRLEYNNHQENVGDVRGRLAGLIRAVISAPSGQRNSTLHWAACRMGELVSVGTIRPEAAAALLIEAGGQVGLDAREVRATIASGFSSVMGA